MGIIHLISAVQHIHKAQKARAFMPQLTLDDISMPGKSNRHPWQDRTCYEQGQLTGS